MTSSRNRSLIIPPLLSLPSQYAEEIGSPQVCLGNMMLRK